MIAGVSAVTCEVATVISCYSAWWDLDLDVARWMVVSVSDLHGLSQ